AKFVGFARAGEWLEYSMNVAKGGTFNFSARVACYKAGGKLHIEVDAVNVTGSLTIPSSGGWQKWTTIGKAGISLSAGAHVVRIKMEADGHLGYVGNIDYFTFTPATTATTTTAKPAAVTTTTTKPAAT